MATWEFGGNPPLFNGPDFSPLTKTDAQTWQKDVSVLFTSDEGFAGFAEVNSLPPGVTFDTVNGVYSGTGGATVAGTYSLHVIAYGVDGIIGGSPAPSEANYTWTLIISVAVAPPVFTGPIDSISDSADQVLDCSVFATGQTSYSISPAPPTGITFSTVTGILTVDHNIGVGLYGPFTVGYINGAGVTYSNAFTASVFQDSGTIYVVVPNLIGMTAANSASFAGTFGLLVAQGAKLYDPLFASGVVETQSPTAGVLVIPGSTITVNVNYGQFFTWTNIPDPSSSIWTLKDQALNVPEV